MRIEDEDENENEDDDDEDEDEHDDDDEDDDMHMLECIVLQISMARENANYIHCAFS